jgi:hypothetical protein
MHTGENEMGLRQIVDFTRLGAIVIMLLHFYYYCYGAFEQWHLTAEIGDRFLKNIERTGLFKTVYHSKGIALVLLVISLFGALGKKSEKFSKQTIIFYLVFGLLLYSCSHYLLKLQEDVQVVACIYMGVTTLGFIFILTGGTVLTRYIKLQMDKDIFNELNETFPRKKDCLKMNIPSISPHGIN